jgi:hypothetical protein
MHARNARSTTRSPAAQARAARRRAQRGRRRDDREGAVDNPTLHTPHISGALRPSRPAALPAANRPRLPLPVTMSFCHCGLPRRRRVLCGCGCVCGGWSVARVRALSPRGCGLLHQGAAATCGDRPLPRGCGLHRGGRDTVSPPHTAFRLRRPPCCVVLCELTHAHAFDCWSPPVTMSL